MTAFTPHKHTVLFALITFILLLVSSGAYAILDSSAIKIFAVTEDEKGLAADLFLYTIPGNGSVAFTTSNSLVGKDTQTTGNIALEVAQQKTGIKLKNKGLLFDIRANASEVDGPSAGAAMTLLTYSLLTEKILNPQVGLTGTINSNGVVGPVGGVYAKSIAAADAGIKLFMIPKGEATQVAKEPNGKVSSINLLSYGPTKLGMTIVEVDTIDDVIKYAYSDISTITVDANTAFDGFVPQAIPYKSLLAPMHTISQGYIDRATASIAAAKKSLETSDLSDSIRGEFYPQLSVAEKNVEMSKTYLDQNYLYSAANYSFNATVSAEAVNAVAQNPSLITPGSNLVDSKASELRNDIAELKTHMQFVPMDKFEWIIAAEQRLGYAENALNTIAQVPTDMSDLTVIQQQAVLFAKVETYASAKAWTDVARDFLAEAQKSTNKKVVIFDTQFRNSVTERMSSVNTIVQDFNLIRNPAAADSVIDANRRLASAKIEYESGFVLAALYDTAFAEALVSSEKSIADLDTNELTLLTNNQLLLGTGYTSVWSNLFFDHATFYVQNADYYAQQGKTLEQRESLKTAAGLFKISDALESEKRKIQGYLASALTKDYVPTSPVVEITSTGKQRFPFENLLPFALIFVLIVLILVLIGLHIKRRAVTERIHSTLDRLDRALGQKKISDAEYFYIKKNYQDRLQNTDAMRAQRSKLTLNLDESRAKLRALEKGLLDLQKHYRSGLIIEEDYTAHSEQVSKEIADIRAQVHEFQSELREVRAVRNPIFSGFFGLFKPKNSASQEQAPVQKELTLADVARDMNSKKVQRRWASKESGSIKGTRDLIAFDEKEERLEKAKRKKLIKDKE